MHCWDSLLCIFEKSAHCKNSLFYTVGIKYLKKNQNPYTECDHSGAHYYALLGLITLHTDKVSEHFNALLGLTSIPT